MVTPRLALTGVCKRYPGVVANDNVSLSVDPGEIHAVLGENGAGKSTLMKIIYGAISADSGSIECDGKAVPEHGPAQSRALGIEMVYQHFALFESISVVENIALSIPGKLELVSLAKQILAVSTRYGLPIDPSRLVLSLSIGERQRVEIVRCLLRQPKLLILDEPTSVLTPQAVTKLFETLRQLAEEGCSILYISHKLDEVRALCHSATVLRNGQVTGVADPRKVTEAQLTRMMVGADLPETTIPVASPGAKPLLEVNNLSVVPDDITGTTLKSVSLKAYGGEIIGIAGVSGNGQNELAAAISGETTCQHAASVLLDQQAVGHLAPGSRRDLGLGFVPEERLGRGAVPAHDLVENSFLTSHRQGMVRLGMALRQRAATFSSDVIEKYNVKAVGSQSRAESLSGGNLQKFIMGREIEQSPKVLLVSQPTWGVDVGAASYIRRTLVELSRSGKAVIVISEELDELFEICDRLYVICQGTLSASVDRKSTSVEAIGLLMTQTHGNPGTQANEAQDRTHAL